MPGALACAAVLAPAAARGQESRGERWTFAPSFRVNVTDNLLASEESEDTGPETSTSLTLALGYTRTDYLWTAGVQGWTTGTLFGRSRGYDGLRFGLGASGERELSPRARARLGASYADGLNVETLFASPLDFPQVDVRSLSADLGLSYLLGPRTTVSASLDVLAIRYRTDVFFDPALLPAAPPPPAVLLPPGDTDPLPAVPGPEVPDVTREVLAVLAADAPDALSFDHRSWHVGAGVAHRLSPRTSLTAALGYRKTEGEDGNHVDGQLGMQRLLDAHTTVALTYTGQDSRFRTRFRSHSLVARADRALRPRLRVDASLGAGYREGAAGEWELLGGAGASLGLKRTSLFARFERTQYLARIVGRTYTTDTLTAGLGHRLGRRLFFGAHGTVRDARDADGAASYRTAFVGGSLSTRFNRRLAGGLNYTYQLLERAALDPLDRSVLSVSVGLR